MTDLPADEPLDTDEIFTTTTADGTMPVSRINDRIMGNDRPGPVSRKLYDYFWQRRAQDWHATPVQYDLVNQD